MKGRGYQNARLYSSGMRGTRPICVPYLEQLCQVLTWPQSIAPHLDLLKAYLLNGQWCSQKRCMIWTLAGSLITAINTACIYQKTFLSTFSLFNSSIIWICSTLINLGYPEITLENPKPFKERQLRYINSKRFREQLMEDSLPERSVSNYLSHR